MDRRGFMQSILAAAVAPAVVRAASLMPVIVRATDMEVLKYTCTERYGPAYVNPAVFGLWFEQADGGRIVRVPIHYSKFFKDSNG